MSNESVLKIIDGYIANTENLIREVNGWDVFIENPILKDSEDKIIRQSVAIATKLTLELLRKDIVEDG